MRFRFLRRDLEPVGPRERTRMAEADIRYPLPSQLGIRPFWMSEEIAPGVTRCPKDPENEAA